MSKVMAWCAGLALAGLAAGCGQASAPARAAGSWGRAVEVPGLGALNKGGNASVSSVSCPSAGNCAAVGYYRDQHRNYQGFVTSEKNGVWGRAVEVPGLGALNKGTYSAISEHSTSVSSVSCASAGNCAAGGDYVGGDGLQQGFVAVERDGVWGRAVEVPGLGALNTGGNAKVLSVSCAPAGGCAAGGDYEDQHRNYHGFVTSEENGVWGRAVEVPGLGALNTGGGAAVSSVSCPSPGNCAAGGAYTDGGQNGQGFVAAERDGVWGAAVEVPGLGTLNTGGGAEVLSVSCPSPGNCAAGGDYTDGGQNGQGFVATERHGRWGQAVDVPGLRALNEAAGSPNAEVDSVSCPSAGNCAAVGTYGDPYGSVFVAVEKNGVWGKATDVPTAAGRFAGANSVSCASPGNCAAGGDYSDSSGGVTQGFVAAERHGRWGNGIKVPGLGTLNTGEGAAVLSVSCPPAGSCAAGGDYTDRRDHSQGFVVSQTG